MFCQPAWVVSIYSSGPPAAGCAGTKSTGGFYRPEWSTCRRRRDHDRIPKEGETDRTTEGAHSDPDRINDMALFRIYMRSRATYTACAEHR